MENEYTLIYKKSLAQALNFLGLRFYIYNAENGQKVYSFKNNAKFKETLARLLALRKELEGID